MFSDLELNHPYFGIFALVGFFFWILNFFYIFRRTNLIIPEKYKKRGFQYLRFFVLIIGIVGWLNITYALMGPRRPLGMDKNTIEVSDIFIVLDLSRSMLAEDLKPNRFEAAKEKVHEFVELFPKDRIGIVTFAEKAFTLLPLSTDLKLITKMIDSIELGPLGDGTNIGDSLALAVGRLIQSSAKSKIIILLTDGVSNVGALTPVQASELAVENKIKIYTIGIGGDKEAQIPMGPKVFGMQRYQMIPGGSVDVKTMQEISKMTNGKFYMASDNKALERVLKEINTLEKTEVEYTGKIIYEELYFKYLLIGATLFILCELFRRLLLKEEV